MSKCKSILDFFNFNSESEILKGPDHSKPGHQYQAYQLLVYPTSPNLWMMISDTDSDLEAV